MHGHGDSTGVVTHDRDIGRIAIERTDIFRYPAQGLHLISDAVIARIVDVVAGEEAFQKQTELDSNSKPVPSPLLFTQNSQSVVDCDHDHTGASAVADHRVLQYVIGFEEVFTAIFEFSAVKIDQDWHVLCVAYRLL